MKLPQKTYQWWTKVINNGEVDQRLLRLHQSERTGYTRFLTMANRWKATGLTRAVLEEIADDEFRHSELVAAVLFRRGIIAPMMYPPEAPERYWDQINRGVTDLNTACAAAAFGEVLALNRFRVIIAHPDTPEDVRTLSMEILPDEERHATDLRILAGKEAMDMVRPFHVMGMRALGLVDIEDANDSEDMQNRAIFRLDVG